MADFRSKKNLEKLLKAAENIKRKEAEKAFSEIVKKKSAEQKALQSASRTSSKVTAGKFPGKVGKASKVLHPEVIAKRAVVSKGGDIVASKGLDVAKKAAVDVTPKSIGSRMMSVGSKAIGPISTLMMALNPSEIATDPREEEMHNLLAKKQAIQALKPAESLQAKSTVQNYPQSIRVQPVGPGETDLSIIAEKTGMETTGAVQIAQKPGGALNMGDSPILSEMKKDPAETISLAVNKAPEAAKKLLDQQSAPDPVKNAAAEVLSDRQRLSSKLDEIQAKKQNNQELGLVDQFVESMAFFLPTALGALVGGAIEGTAGAVAGAQQATGLAQAKRDFDLESQEQQRKQIETLAKLSGDSGLDLDKTPDFIDARTGQSITSGTLNNKLIYMDSDGKIVPGEFALRADFISLDKHQTRIDRRQQLSQQLARQQLVNTEVKSATSAPTVKSFQKAIPQIESKLNLLSTDAKLTSDFLKPFIARGILGEVGNLSETDLDIAQVPNDFYNKMKTNVKEFLFGDMTTQQRQQTKKLFQYVVDLDKAKIVEKLDLSASEEKAKRLNIPRTQLRNEMLRRAGIDPARVPIIQAKAWLRKNPKDKRAKGIMEKLKRAGAL